MKPPFFIAFKPRLHRAQQGITLIVCLILLTVLSATAAMTINGSTTVEQFSNNSRSQLLAYQLAEAALRYTEKGTINYDLTSNSATPTTAYANISILAAPAAGVTATWADLANWDSATPAATEIQRYKLDDYSATAAPGTGSPINLYSALYKRNPDCIAQYIAAGSRSFNVVCRGFGPEVPADRSLPPAGAEVFLQSTILN